ALSASLLAEQDRMDLAHHLDRVKWFLWRGYMFKIMQRLELIQIDVEALQGAEDRPEAAKLQKALEEFCTYIHNNRVFIPTTVSAIVTARLSPQLSWNLP